MSRPPELPWRAYVESAAAVVRLAAARPPGDCVRDALTDLALQTLDLASIAFLVQRDPAWWVDMRDLHESIGPVYGLAGDLAREVEAWRREQSRRRDRDADIVRELEA